MHNHIHNCKHESLKHCPVCDTVYCTNCDKEWKVTSYIWYPYNTITYTEPLTPTVSVYNSDSPSTPTTHHCRNTVE